MSVIISTHFPTFIVLITKNRKICLHKNLLCVVSFIPDIPLTMIKDRKNQFSKKEKSIGIWVDCPILIPISNCRRAKEGNGSE
jgi:hypothetical protein